MEKLQIFGGQSVFVLFLFCPLDDIVNDTFHQGIVR